MKPLRWIVAFVCLAGALSAQTTITGTITGLLGAGWQGTVTITASNSCTPAGGGINALSRATVDMTTSTTGTFQNADGTAVTLMPVDVCAETGTHYDVRYRGLDGGGWEEEWSVTSSSPDAIEDIRTTSTSIGAAIGYGAITGCTAKGSMLAASGTALGCEAVGTNDFVLTADSGQTNGVKWAAVGATLDVVFGNSGLSNADYLVAVSSAGTIKEAATLQYASNILRNGTAATDVAVKFTSGGTPEILFRTGDDSANILATGLIFNAGTGFRINGGATSGEYLRGNGTNFLSSAIQAADIAGLSPSVTGAYDFSGASSTHPNKSGASAPASCTVGDTFYDTDANIQGAQLACPTTNEFNSVAPALCNPSGGTDSYSCATPNEALFTGLTIIFKPDVNNTGACTVDIDEGGSIAAKPIQVLTAGAQADPANDDIDANWIYFCAYDGTSFLCTRDGAAGGAGDDFGAGDPGGNGIMVRDALDSSVARSIAVGAGILVANGDGVSGNPTISPDTTILPTLAQNNTWTGEQDFGGATSVEIPNAAAPTVNAAGEIALDTTVADMTSVMRAYGAEELAFIPVPIAEIASLTDGDVIAYNAANDEFEITAAAGGSSTTTKDYYFPVATREASGSTTASGWYVHTTNGATIFSDGSTPFGFAGARFAAAGTTTITFGWKLPANWDGVDGTFDVAFKTRTGTGANGNVKYLLKTGCGDGATPPDPEPTWNTELDTTLATTASTLADWNPAPVVTNCDAGELFWMVLQREGDDGGDTSAHNWEIYGLRVQLVENLD